MVGSRHGLVSVLLMGFALAGCGEDQPVGLADRSLDPAGKPASGDPTVTSTDPSGAPVDTTLVVRVLGSGYDAGSTADFALDGQTIPQVRTNATTFVSSKELRANITIDADAPTDLYDVIVTTSKGKRGIGIEKFAVFITATSLGTLGGASFATAVNGHGEVAGWSEYRRNSGRSHVFFWSASSGMEDLGEGGVGDISEGAEIVGSQRSGSNFLQAVIWTRNGPGNWSILNLPVPGGYKSGAAAISPSGSYIAGSVGVGSPYENQAVWMRDGGGWSLSILPSSGSAADVNDDGLVLGRSSGQASVWIFESGTWVAHPLDIPSSAPKGVSLHSINSAGDVLGTSCCEQLEVRPLVWRRTASGWSSAEEVPAIPPGSGVMAMNDAGHIAGGYIDSRGEWRAFLCCNGGLVDLGTPGGSSSIAHHVGPAGHVAGQSGTASMAKAYLWTVPWATSPR
ncbi:MAG TPA: hypothetical protein VEY33_09520 [Gemmatimonadota bacterium]|nr:hypothetical protein [Gemmatimonadota bacterium]